MADMASYGETSCCCLPLDIDSPLSSMSD
jgi:hypothetical protein